MSDEKSKIIIDENWKEQVQREKEEARLKKNSPETATPEAPETKREASFMSLVGMLMTEAMLALGMLAPRDAEEIMVDLEHAKFVIDTLMILRQKTAGNLTPEEEGRLTEGIARLQSYYVALIQHLQEEEMKQGGINLHDLRKP